MTRPCVSFAFYTGLGASEPWLNRIVAMITGPYMHCEIVFNEPGGKHVACGVWQGEKTFMRRKTFGKKCWIWRTLNVTAEQQRKMRRFCTQQAKLQVPFNRWGLWRCCSPFPRKSDGKAWFCSELCVCSLQCAGLLLDEVASACTPTYLYSCIMKMGAFSAAAPARLLNQRIARQQLKYKWTKQLFVV